MAHGFPDYGVASAISTLYQVLDLGELAARLGYAGVFDRRGMLLDAETWEHGIGRVAIWGGNPFDAWDLAVGTGRGDGYSLRVQPDGGEESVVYVLKQCVFPSGGVLGLELSWCHDSEDLSLELLLSQSDGTTIGECGWRYAYPTGVLEYSPNGADYVVLATGLDAQGGEGNWNTIKLVADLLSGAPKRLIFNRHVYDLSEQDLDLETGPYIEKVYWQVNVWPVDGSSPQVWLDDVLLTINEP